MEKLSEVSTQYIQDFSCVEYMSPQGRVTPLGLCLALTQKARIPIGKQIRDILKEAYPNQYMGWFTITAEFNFTDAWHTLMTNKSQLDIFPDQRENGIYVKLKEPIQMTMKTTYIGERTFQVEDEYFSINGTKLSNFKILYGIVDLEQRKMVPVPDHLRNMAPNVKDPVKPTYIKMKFPTTAGVTREDVVEGSNIDINNHTNYNYYLEVANKAFDSVKPDKSVLKKFVALWKNETGLGDVLKSTVWKSDVPGHYCCMTSCNDKVATFCEATYKTQSSKL